MSHTSFAPEFIEEMKKMLLDEKAKLTTRLKSLKAQDPFSDVDRLNDNAASDTEAKEESDHERTEALVTDQNARLNEITAALERMQKGTYGICLKTGKPIEEKRLRVNPAALYCLDYEQQLKS
jgi:RNA polymerase-binding transcription factor DksA